jgi:hypothetical protein
MLKKIPWVNILIVCTVMLIVPVMAFAMSGASDPSESNDDDQSQINSSVTIASQPSDEQNPEAASTATGVLENNDTQGGTGVDAISSATGDPGSPGSIGEDDDSDDDDEQYENDDDDEDDGEAIKEDDDDDEAEGDD